MIVLFCGAIGISLAVEVGRRCERAQLLCRLGEQVRLLLDYSMTDTGAIFAQLASDPRFAPFGFLQGCDPAKPVTVATGLTARDDQELAAFLQRLGKSDLQNQLRLTDGYIAFAKGRAEEYAARCKRQKQLYVAFGLSGGLGAQRTGGPGHAHHPGRGDCGFDDVGAEDQRAFLRYKIYV